MAQLAKLSRRTRVLFSGAGFSKSTWGFQTAGLSFAHWVKIEVAAANAAGFNQGRCRYSSLCIAYGENGHPFVRAIRELFVLWFKLIIPLVKTKDKFLDELSVAWQLIKAQVNPDDKQITFKDSLIKVQGVVSQVVVFLYCLGWDPVRFDKWVSPAKESWQFLQIGDNPFPIGDMIKELTKSYHAQQTVLARKHYDGASLVSPVCWHETTTRNKSLKNKKKFAELAILETVQAGAAWPTDRVAERLLKSNICPLCELPVAPGDIWHKYWTCPCIKDKDIPAIKDSNLLIDKLDLEEVSFYNRAILCEHHITPPSGFAPLDEYVLFTEVIDPKLIAQAPAPAVPEAPKTTNIKGSVWFPNRDPEEPSAVPYEIPEVPQVSTAGRAEEFIPVVGQVFYEGFPAAPEVPSEYSSTARSSSDPAPAAEHSQSTNNLSPSLVPEPWPSGYYFGDGSGGKYSKYLTLRRAGVGLHHVSPDKTPTYSFWQALPGPQQTVPRAELFALLLAVEHVEVDSVIDFFTDSLITANTFNKGPSRAKFAANADLWCQLFQSIEIKNLLVRV